METKNEDNRLIVTKMQEVVVAYSLDEILAQINQCEITIQNAQSNMDFWNDQKSLAHEKGVVTATEYEVIKAEEKALARAVDVAAQESALPEEEEVDVQTELEE